MNEAVRQYWEREPCGTSPAVTDHLTPGTREWSERIEERRYLLEPFIHSLAQFTRHRGKEVLEVGVGAGTDHLQWARAGAVCHGVDLTDAAIQTTRERLGLYGLQSDLRRIDAERLPFEDRTFDIVYSWGVIHHADHPELIASEIHRVLRPGGLFLGMMYGRRSIVALKLWIKYGLLRGRPWRTLADVIWHHMESIGTKAYTLPELRSLFREFAVFDPMPILTPYDMEHIPASFGQFLPKSFGWFIALRAVR